MSMSRPEKANDLIRELRPDETPEMVSTKLSRSNESFQTTLMKSAVTKSGRSLDSPGEVDQFFFEDEQMLVIDLRQDNV